MIKEVKTSKNSDSTSKKKRNFYFTIYNYIRQGLNPTQICQTINISKQKLNYYVASLKTSGFITKVGYGTWEITKEFNQSKVKTSKNSDSHSDYTHPTPFLKSPILKSDSNRSHAFIFKLFIPKIPAWDRLFTILEGEGLSPKRLPHKGVSVVFKGKRIHFWSRSVIVYDSESYLFEFARDGRSLAIFKFKELIHSLESLLKVSFLVNKGYKFRVRREHHALIKNSLARQYDTEGRKLWVKDINGFWLWIDNSFNLNELEVVKNRSPEDLQAVLDNEGVQKFFNEMKSTNWEVTPKFILQAFKGQSQVMDGIQAVQLVFNKNMSSHIKAVQDLSLGVQDFTGVVGSLVALLKKLENLLKKLEKP